MLDSFALFTYCHVIIFLSYRIATSIRPLLWTIVNVGQSYKATYSYAILLERENTEFPSHLHIHICPVFCYSLYRLARKLILLSQFLVGTGVVDQREILDGYFPGEVACGEIAYDVWKVLAVQVGETDGDMWCP